METDGLVNQIQAKSSPLTKVIENLLADVHNKRSSWVWALPNIFRKHERLVLNHTTVLKRLPSGRLLVLRALPLAANKTLIDCNIYAKLPRRTKATQSELETIKQQVDLGIKRLELEQRTLIDGSSYLYSRRISETP